MAFLVSLLSCQVPMQQVIIDKITPKIKYSTPHSVMLDPTVTEKESIFSEVSLPEYFLNWASAVLTALDPISSVEKRVFLLVAI